MELFENILRLVLVRESLTGENAHYFFIMIMIVTFGIDVSKTSSEVTILVNGEQVHGYTIPNNAIELTHLLNNKKTSGILRLYLKQLVFSPLPPNFS